MELAQAREQEEQEGAETTRSDKRTGSEAQGGACIIPGDAPEVVEIRRLIAKVHRRIKLERQGGIWVLRNWFMDDLPVQGFARPGTKP